ncbi:Chorismate synthase [Peptoniphilus sp. ING2-D1G]|nr:Chorismate synthase [Peptoniphilus sp. ING2-D1G]
MSSIFGNNVKISIFGESHGKAIGVVMDGLPAGEEIDEEKLLDFMKRRAPGQKFTTGRKEEDVPCLLSGIYQGKTTGSPLCAIIENKNQRSQDYSNLREVPRPSHADLTAYFKYENFADLRGGGHFSGRLTAPLCIAGAIAKQILEKREVYIGAQLFSVGEVEGKSFRKSDLCVDEVLSPGKKEFPALDEKTENRMKEVIQRVKAEGDSIGGSVECAAIGFPKGIGTPIFDGMENRIAQMIFGIPGVRSLEFGAGTDATKMKGSLHNDPIEIKKGEICTRTNNAGGINGGITNGMPIIIRVGMKPTPSIAIEQDSINFRKMEGEKLQIKGRHDPCIAIRAVPVVEAAMAVVLLDEWLGDGNGFKRS